MPSPFPGMDPYLEDPGLWPDVHHGLISQIQAALNPVVGPKYLVRVETRVYISGEDDPGRPALVPDLRVAQRPRRKAASTPSPVAKRPAVSEPEVLTTLIDEEIKEPFLVVRDRADRQVITVIEVLSPSNKIAGSEGRRSYQQKKAEILRSPSHWMEIDLLRTGVPSVPRLAGPYDYVVHVSRADKRPTGHVWRIMLAETLPVVGVPLKPGDADAPLDLQPVLNTTYDHAAYAWEIDYRRPPAVPLTREQARWANQLLRDKGLR